MKFDELGVQDKRLLCALEKQGLLEATLVQEKSLPIILNEKKDALIKAKTGSGKTLIYALPILVHVLGYLDALLKNPNFSGETTKFSGQAIVLVPSKELADQVTSSIERLLVYFPTKQVPLSKILMNLSATQSKKKKSSEDIILKSILKEQGGSLIVISTPSKLLECLEEGLLGFQESLAILAVDEADLLMGFGYDQEMTALLNYFPKTYQCLLLSATLDTSLETLKKLYLKKPVIIKLEEAQEEQTESNTITHYYLPLPDREHEDFKYLLLFTLLKLKLLKGKSLIFTKDSETAYRLKLFLEIFYVKSIVLNGELPIQSRVHMVEEANRGRYDCIIAADPGSSETLLVAEDKNSKPLSKRKRVDTDIEYGVSRGIDFKNVSTVLNFHCPINLKHYKHRTGRTGRGHTTGLALSLISSKEAEVFESIQDAFCQELTSLVEREAESCVVQGEQLQEVQLKAETFKSLEFDLKSVEGFRYRTMDALHGITKNFIVEARAKDLQKEMAFNTKLACNAALLTQSIGSLVYHPDSYESRKVTECIVHDKSLLKPGKQQKHMKNIPQYLFLSTGASEKDEGIPTISKARLKVPALSLEFQKDQQNVLAKVSKRISTKKRNNKKTNNPLKKLKL